MVFREMGLFINDVSLCPPQADWWFPQCEWASLAGTTIELDNLKWLVIFVDEYEHLILVNWMVTDA